MAVEAKGASRLQPGLDEVMDIKEAHFLIFIKFEFVFLILICFSFDRMRGEGETGTLREG